MKQILIYGDSLVYGKKPGSAERFEYADRFVGVMASELGAGYTVIAEGLRARTLSGENPFFTERDGLKQFGPIYASHIPLDLVIIFLGTNDCNRSIPKTKEDIYTALHAYITEIKTWNGAMGVTEIYRMPQVLLVAPPYILSEEVNKDEKMSKIFGPDAEERSHVLNASIQSFAKENGIHCIDAASIVIAASGEGVHIGLEQNKILGKVLAQNVRDIVQ